MVFVIPGDDHPAGDCDLRRLWHPASDRRNHCFRWIFMQKGKRLVAFKINGLHGSGNSVRPAAQLDPHNKRARTSRFVMISSAASVSPAALME